MRTLMTARLAALLWAAMGTASAQPADSMLRIACEGDSEGAEVTLNGQFKGQCPVDVKVAAGTLKLRAEKKMGPNHIGLYEREVRVGDGVVQRVQVALERKLTPEGRKLADERNAAALAAHEQAKADHGRQLLAHQSQVQKCAQDMATAAHQRMMHCWTHSGGCVGPWPCENSQKRMQRCSSNGKGYFDESEFTGTCRSRLPVPAAPRAPVLETD